MTLFLSLVLAGPVYASEPHPETSVLVFRDPASASVPSVYLDQVTARIGAFLGQHQFTYLDPTLLKGLLQNNPELQASLKSLSPTDRQIREIIDQIQAQVYITFGFEQREGLRYVFTLKAFETSTAEAFAIAPPQYMILDSLQPEQTQAELNKALAMALEGPYGLFARLQERLLVQSRQPLILRFHLPQNHLRTVYRVLKPHAESLVLKLVEADLVVFEIQPKESLDLDSLLLKLESQIHLKRKAPIIQENHYELYFIQN